MIALLSAEHVGGDQEEVEGVVGRDALFGAILEGVRGPSR